MPLLEIKGSSLLRWHPRPIGKTERTSSKTDSEERG
jgi:hypothetical protein